VAVKVLVSAASRHGATAEVAANIGATLQAAGHDAFVLAPDEVQRVDGYDAAVIGSGVYVGKWLDPAKDLLGRHKVARRARPAARTLAAHCEPAPSGTGIRAVSPRIVGCTGVNLARPLVRPMCSRVAISAFAVPGMPCSSSHGFTVAFIRCRSHGIWSAAGLRSSAARRSAATPIAAPAMRRPTALRTIARSSLQGSRA
jgi:hypothetical protein